LKQKLNEILPKEKELRVIASHNSVTLSGRVSNAASLSQAMALAEAYAPGKGKEKQNVNNLVTIGGVHQVMLEVRIAEMSRSLIKRLGVNFNWVNGEDFGVSTLGGLTQLVKPDLANVASGGPFGLFVTPSVNALFRFQSGSSTWTGFVSNFMSGLNKPPGTMSVPGSMPIKPRLAGKRAVRISETRYCRPCESML